MGRNRLVTAMLIGLAIVVLLAACGGATSTPAPTATPAAELASTPAPTAAPASTPMPTSRGTPTPTPSSTLASTPDSTPPSTPQPAELGVAAFLQQCEQATVALATPFMGGAIDLNQLAQSDDITWGNIADIYASAVDAYSELNPPHELQEYHNAWLRTSEAFRDHARTQPSEESFIGEFLVLLLETVFPASLEIGFDPDKSEEEKQWLLEALFKEALGEFLGPDFAAAGEAHDEALRALSAETSALLEESGCYFGLTPFSEAEGQGGLTLEGGATVIRDIDDDHGDTFEGASAMAVDVPVEGAMDYFGDSDFFLFQAEEGKVYKIYVDPGTLSNPLTTLYGADEQQLDFADSTAIFWETQASGDHYVEVTVWSDDTGSYVLTVSNVDDDHGNSLATASPAVVGQPVQVSIGYDGDLDYLVFQAEEGQSYHISVELGTVSEASLTLYDVDRFLQAFGPGPIDWEAPASGDYYVEATAFGETGTYSVSVTASGS